MLVSHATNYQLGRTSSSACSYLPLGSSHSLRSGTVVCFHCLEPLQMPPGLPKIFYGPVRGHTVLQTRICNNDNRSTELTSLGGKVPVGQQMTALVSVSTGIETAAGLHLVAAAGLYAVRARRRLVVGDACMGRSLRSNMTPDGYSSARLPTASWSRRFPCHVATCCF